MLLAAASRIALALFLATVLAGCGSSSAPESPTKAGTETVTFHVTDMGKRLALMWEDWPNRVKEALVGLPGVVLVRDEWDHDLLHVTFNRPQMTVEKLREIIKKEGFEADLQAKPK